MRLVHQTFFVLAAVVLIAVGSMAALFALTLESGFVAYVNARQLEQFEVLYKLLTEQVALDGSLQPIMRNENMWRRLMRQSEPSSRAGGDDGFRSGAPPIPGSRRPGYGKFGGRREDFDKAGPREDLVGPRDEFKRGQLQDFGGPRDGFGKGDPRGRLSQVGPLSPTAPRADPPPPEAEDPPPPRPPPAAARGGPPANNPYGLGQNVVLLSADRVPVYRSARILGRETTPIERAVKVDERIEGFVQLWPLDKVDRPEDLAYLRSQYRQLAWGAGVLVLLILGVAPLVARRITQPLRSVTEATERIAKGDLDVRLPTSRGDEIGTLMKNVNGMADSLQRLEQTRKRWIAEIAHELRTPLTVLQAELEALAVGVRPLDKAAIVSLQDETRQLTRLVGDLHQLALADLDALPCTMAPVDLVDLAKRVVDRYRSQARRKGIELDGVMPPGRVNLEADAQRLEQLLGNLLQNSIRYTDPPGRIVVRVDVAVSVARLIVEDSPPGVAASDIERLFDPLYRADKARSRKSGGSGLGLAICRAIVHAHGGTISASPSPLGGLRFCATLPLPT